MQQGQQADKQWQQRPDRCCQPHVCVGGMQAAEAGADCPSPACMLDAGYRKTDHLGSTHLWKQRSGCRGRRMQPLSCRRAGRNRRANGQWDWAALARDGCGGLAQVGVRWHLHRTLQSGEVMAPVQEFARTGSQVTHCGLDAGPAHRGSGGPLCLCKDVGSRQAAQQGLCCSCAVSC